MIDQWAIGMGVLCCETHGNSALGQPTSWSVQAGGSPGRPG